MRMDVREYQGHDLHRLFEYWRKVGQVRYLHTDTASGNVRAQQLYKKLGFQQEGYTRSYAQA